MTRIKRILNRIRTNPKSILIHVFRMTVGKILPSACYLRVMNRVYLHKKLNLKKPQTFNEKLQWLKLNCREDRFTRMVDKCEAKKYVADIIGEKYIIPTLGVWDKYDDIEFEKLPEQFVLKCTHDSGGLVIVRDKNGFDATQAKRMIGKSLKRNYYWIGREWPYKNVKPRIIAEKYMEDASGHSKELIDYKFFCFGGQVKFLYVSQGLENHETASITFYDMEFNEMPFKRSDFKTLDGKPEKPKNFSEMVAIAEKLSHRLPFLRVDLYEINGKVFFSELTFSPCSGWLPFEPEEWDKKLGDMIDLSLVER